MKFVGMRNFIAHDYLARVFEMAMVFVPDLIVRLPAIIAEVEAGA